MHAARRGPATPHSPKLVWDLLGGAMDRTSYGCILYSFRNGTRLLASAFVRDMVRAGAAHVWCMGGCMWRRGRGPTHGHHSSCYVSFLSLIETIMSPCTLQIQVQLLDTTNPLKPKLLDTLQMPKGAGELHGSQPRARTTTFHTLPV